MNLSMQNLLERLEQWLTRNRSDYASKLLPGLSLEEIAEITSQLPFQLPNEVVQLYQWRNGTPEFYDEFFLFFRFLPLQEAVEDTLMMRKCPEAQGSYKSQFQDSGLPDWQYYWFSVFYETKERIVTVGSNHPSNSSPTIHFYVGGRKTWFKSLKGFISTILECYETELYLLEDFWIDDAGEICAKYRDLE
jgi:hypothetical protein